MKQITKKPKKKVGKTIQPTQTSERRDQEEEILQAATMELVTKHGGHFIATGLRETRIKEIRVWIITVTLRYEKGDEGYIGDLLFDGEKFTFLTDQSVMDERARQIADNPEGIRKWNEYRASTLRTRKA